MSIEKRTTYERLENGIDFYTLKTTTKDVVICKMAFPGGSDLVHTRYILAPLMSDLLPGGTKNMKKGAVLDMFETLGARVNISCSEESTQVTISSRKQNFLQAFKLLSEVIVHTSFTQTDFQSTSSKIYNNVHMLKENTQELSQIALRRAMYKKRHPHWRPSITEMLKDLETTTLDDVRNTYKNMFATVGAHVVIVGDMKGGDIPKEVMKELSHFPTKRKPELSLHSEEIRTTGNNDTVISVREKMNIDTMLGIPIPITNNSDDLTALKFGVHILGGASSSRLFNVLRTQQSLTYGARALLGEEGSGYPMFLYAYAIFPKLVFAQGRKVLKEVVSDFVNHGVTGREVRVQKECVLGRFVLQTSTTAGLLEALYTTVHRNKTARDIDTFTDTIQSMTAKKVNEAIFAHIDYSLAKTAAAGAVRAD